MTPIAFLMMVCEELSRATGESFTVFQVHNSRSYVQVLKGDEKQPIEEFTLTGDNSDDLPLIADVSTELLNQYA